MSIKQKLKNYPSLYIFIVQVLNSVNYFTLRFKILFPRYKLSENWRKRLERVKESPANHKINHVQDAGKIKSDHQVMHNGLKITLGSYYDYGNTVLIRENKGVHEPEEEFAFQEVLKHIPKGGCMLELGSYWAYYSMWFAREVKNARCVMIEPDPHKMNFGKLNFKLNRLLGTFDLGFMNEIADLSHSIPTYSVDYLVEKYDLRFIDILHSDIQGYELNMLKGAAQTLRAGKIGYVFISTHSNSKFK